MQRTAHRPLRRQKTNSQIVTYVVLLIITVAFIMTVGLQLVLAASRFIAGFGQKSDELNHASTEVVVPPVLYDLPDATNSAKLAINGTSSGDGTVTIFVNDESVEDITVDSSNPDFKTIVNLDQNENTIYAQFKDKKNRIKDSDTYTVEYVKEKPTLVINSPADGSHTLDSEITVSGSTGQNDRLKINGDPVVLNADGSFSYRLTLSQGENTIAVASTDDAGNIQEASIKVTYEP